MNPTPPIYWIFSNWKLSGVCIFCNYLISALNNRNHYLCLIGDLSLDIPLPQNLKIKRFHSYEHFDQFLSECPDAIVLNSFSWQASCSKRRSRHRYIQVLQSHDPYYYFPLIFSLNRWHAVVAVSNEIIRSVAQIGGHAVRIPNGVPSVYDSTRIDPPNRKIHLLYAGRLVEVQKRVSRLIEIAKGLRNRDVPFEIRILGSGQMESRLRSYFSFEEMPGACPAAEMSRHYKWAHFFLLPSDFEGESLALLEALAHGCVPVLGPFESDASDQLNHLGLGYRGDTTGMIEYLAPFATERDQWLGLSTRVRDYFENSEFIIDAVAARYETLFQQVQKMPDIVAPESLRVRFLLKLFTKLLFSRFRGPVTKLALASLKLK